MHILREANEHGSRPSGTLEFSDEVCANIARGNENMTAEQVKAALMNGSTVYTHFSKFKLVRD